jgi:hypothetical protein
MPFKHMDEIAVYWIGNACEWRPETVQRAYELVVRSWTDAGREPNQIGAHAPGVGRNYGAFKQKRRFIEQAGFENIRSLSIARLPDGCRHVSAESELDTFIGPDLSLLSAGCVPSLVGVVANVVRDCAEKLIVLTNCPYAYMLRREKLYAPGNYALGMDVHVDHDWRDWDLSQNIQNWSPEMAKLTPLLSAGILRNIYPENYLSTPHLDARLGTSSTTLKQWIEADPAGRGTLDSFSDILTQWTPPIQKIPQIREELYRAGRVFYWRFTRPGFRNGQGGMTPEPLYRPDLSAPWEAPEPIPEIYRADFWKDKDPGLTY